MLYAQAMLVGIVEKQQCPQYGAFAYALRSGEMHIAVYGNLRIRNVGAIYKNNLIQALHLR